MMAVTNKETLGVIVEQNLVADQKQDPLIEKKLPGTFRTLGKILVDAEYDSDPNHWAEWG